MPGAVNVKIAWTRPGGGAAPAITSPAFLVTGTVDTVYPTTTFTATGTAPITWSVTPGTLPAGMAFSSAGVLSGTPTATASGSITFTATNAYGSANTSLALTVNAAGTGYEPAWLSQVTGADSTFDPPLETTGTILYVATTGNDTTGTGAIGSPYATIGKANSMLTAGVGGTIYVRGGTYSMAAATVYLKGGTSLSWTRVRRYPGESVILDGGFGQTAPFESVDQYGYLEIHGFKTRYFNAWGIFVDRNGGSNYLIRNCTATESPAALKFAANGPAATPVPPAVATDITIQNIAWEMTPARITASASGNVLTISAISSGVIFVGANVYTAGSNALVGQIQSQLTGVTGSTGTYQLGNTATYSSIAMVATKGLTGIDFGPGVCSNISIDLVKIQRINPINTGDTAADGIAVETGGNITIDRSYVKDVDGDCIDIKNDLGNYNLKRSFGIQINSGRNIFKAWPGAGYTSTFDNCFAYNAAGRGTSGGLGMVALAGTTGSHILRRCTFINENSSGEVVNARVAPGTTKTIQGCILAITNPSSTKVIVEMNSTPSSSIKALSNVGTTATVETFAPLGIVVGQQVKVTGATDEFFNVTNATITSVNNSSSRYFFSYTMAGTPSTTTFTSAVAFIVGASTITDFKYNLFYSPRTDAYIRNNYLPNGTPNPSVSQANISSGAFDTTYASAGMVGNAVGQPTYANAAAFNFRLAASDTAAFNKYLTNNGIATDADGLNGTVYTYQDIGAFERQ
jgi:hypothetical protein